LSKTTVLDQEDQEEKSISKCYQFTSEDVNKLLLYCYIEKDYYDLIHINSFGSNSIFCGSALASVVHAGEHRPYK
jgi:tRNA G26 N,N-dimethylase Trm1